MENKFRNELEVTLSGEKILLRPTFENIANMESNVGSIAYLAWKFSRGVTVQGDGTTKPNEDMIKSFPSLSETAQIIFYNQAEKKLSLEEIWDLILKNGNPKDLMIKVTVFIGRTLSGGNFDEEKEATEEEKKS